MTAIREQLERCAFDEVLWGAAAGEDCLAASIAAAHLGLWREARTWALRWAEGGAHVEEGPLVSIVVPTHDRPQLLRRALSSVAAQLYRPIEVVVVNDAGEPVERILEGFRDRLTIKSIVHSENRYLAACRNSALEQVEGRYVGYLDDDDQLYPHHVGHLIALLQATGGRAAHALPYMHRRSPTGDGEQLETYPFKPFQWFELLVDNVIPVQAMLHEVALLERVGPFDTSLRANEDWEFWIRLRRETAVEQSPVISSCVEARSVAGRMAGALAPFLHAHRVIYRRYADLSRRVGGEAIQARQRKELNDLAANVRRQVHERRRVALAVADDDPESADEAARAVRQASGTGTESPPVITLDSEDPRQPARALRELLDDETVDHVAVVEAFLADTLTPDGWTGLASHLELDPRAAAAAPIELGSLSPEQRRRWSDGDDLPAGSELAARLAERHGLDAEEVESLDSGCVMLRAAALREVGLPEVEGDAERFWQALFARLRAAGWRLRRAIDVVLLPAYGDEEIASTFAPLPTASRPPVSRPPRLVLAYHRVVHQRDDDPYGLAVSRATFEAQLDLLQAKFRIVGPENWRDDPHDDDPRSRLLITLDDGYRDNYEVAYPVLWKRGLPAVLFAATGSINSGKPFWWELLAASSGFAELDPKQRSRLQEEWRYLPPAERGHREAELEIAEGKRGELSARIATWSMLAEMQESGSFTIGAHTRLHPSLGRLGDADLAEEIDGSIADLERELGRRPTWFAFPHGSPDDLSPDAIERLSAAGIEYAFTTSPGVIDAASLDRPGTPQALTLPRFLVGEEEPESLVARLEGFLGRPAAPPVSAQTRRRRSIVVLSGITANNLGDDAMLIALVRDLQRLDPQAKLVVLAEDPARCGPVQDQITVPILRSMQGLVQRFLRELPPDETPTMAVAALAQRILEQAELFLGGRSIAEVPAEYEEGLRRLMTADGVVDCGGANLSAHWKSFFYEKCVDYLVAAKPLLVSGQGIDRFDDPIDRQLLNAALSQVTELTLREPVSEAYLEQIGCEAPMATTGDDALTLEPSAPARRARLLGLAGQRPEQPYLAFQYRHYLDYEAEEYYDRFAAYVDSAIEASGLSVVAVPMHFDGTDEREHLRRLAERVRNVDRFHVVESHLTPSDAMALFGGSRLAFGISYHSAILSLASRVPYLGLYRGDHYTQKMTGLERLFRLPGMSVPVDTTPPAAFADLVSERLRDHEAIHDHLTARVQSLTRRVLDSRSRFLERVEPSITTARQPERAVAPALAGIDWGQLRSLEPVSRQWGFDRGRPVDRFYIERFLERESGRVHGSCCELLNDDYTRRYGGDRVESADVLDLDTANLRATVIDDLTAPRVLGRERFDCFILTQTLPYIHDCGAALAHAYRSLREGGALLITVPSIIKYHREPEDHWRFTEDSLRGLIERHCPGAEFRVEAHGNLVTATAFLHGLAVEDLSTAELEARDPEYPLVVTATIVRRSLAASDPVQVAS